jgi:alpha-L-fucosidase
MGAYAMCFTAKHEGGFALWPSKASNYSVAQSSVPTLDVVGEFVQSCRKFGLQPCFYESPVENGHLMLQKPTPTTEQFVQQELTMYDELLGGSQYGHIERIWWDH